MAATQKKYLDLTGLTDVVDKLVTLINGKANASHTHTIANVSGLQSSLDSKSPTTHTHTITASASDDDVVILTGSNGTNKVSYTATHANSGVTAGTYRSVTVNAKGHISGGTNPTTVAGYGLTDVYTKSQIDSYNLITVEDIDEICGANIVAATELEF